MDPMGWILRKFAAKKNPWATADGAELRRGFVALIPISQAGW